MNFSRLVSLFFEKLSYKHEDHQYVGYIKHANAGFLHHGNVYCFDYAIKNLPSDNPIIEIGSFCGLSTNIMSFYLRQHSKINRLITSDKWMFEGVGNQDGFLETSSLKHSEYRQYIKDSYIRNIKFFSSQNLPFTIEEFSDDFFKLWESNTLSKDVLGREVQLGGPISFSYIDGNHTYPFAKRDFINTDKFLEKGGFVLFDDSADSSEWNGVKKLMKEVKASGRYELIIRNPNYLFRKIK
ncbi:MAG: class I SAM-dependent methyltransferase [Cytophagaceae bacterium]